jgi:ankyrin repeat protein
VSLEGGIDSCGGCTLVLTALNSGHDEIARYLIRKGAPTAGQICDRWPTRGYSAVHLASQKEAQTDILRTLLLKDQESGCPCFQSPVHPIHIAVACGNNAGLRVILQHIQTLTGAPETSATHILSLDGSFATGEGPHYHEAPPGLSSRTSGREIIWQWQPAPSLLDAQISGIDLQWVWQLSKGELSQALPLTTDDIRAGAALHVAAVVNNLPATKLLLEYGANANCEDGTSRTPLHDACQYSHLWLIDLLLRFGSNTNAQDRWGRTPAMVAASRGQVAILELLRQHHADFSACDIDGQSTLKYAVEGGPEVFSYLLTLGCNPYSPDMDDHTPLLEACRQSRHCHALGPLVCNSDLNFAHRSSRYGGVLQFQAFTDHTISTLRIFLARTPKEIVARDINFSRAFGSPLYRAAVHGAVMVLGLLIRRGADLEIEGGEQGTPLMAACAAGRLTAVKYLVRAGSKLRYTTMDGKFVTAVRAARHFPLVIRWLLAQQYTEQYKIDLAPAEITKHYEICNWSGSMTVKVPMLGFYSRKHGESSLDLAVQLHKLRRDLVGKVVCI